MADVFVSYARADASRVAPLVAALEAEGWSVWWDSQIAPGQEFDSLIAEELDRAKAAIVVWTAASVASRWVRGEARAAADRGILAPVRFDGAPLPIDFRAIHTTDFNGWVGDAGARPFRELADALRQFAGAAPAAPAAASAKAPRKLSVCVLPFANISDDPQQEYFSDGISEDIITDLSKVSALSVAARNTAFAFKGKNPNIPDLARQLGVSHVLEGSVRKAGNRVRITAQLIDGAAGDHLWAERWDRDLTDIFALQDEISAAIVAALKLKLLPEEKKAIEKRGTESAEAWSLYQMARRQWVAGNTGDPRREEAVIRLCQRAVEIDPGYARAWAQLAFAQHTLRFNRGRPGDDGQAAAETAIGLDAELAEAHAVRARNLEVRRQSDAARQELALALRLDPGSVDVLAAAADFAYRDGRLEEAERFYVKGMALDETDFATPAMLVSVRSALGDPEGARAAAKITLERVQPVIAQSPNNGFAGAFGAQALTTLGEFDRAREWMDRALLVDPDNQLMRYNFACLAARELGDRERALDLLGPVFDNVTPNLLLAARTDPDLASIRDDPRFQAMLAEAEQRLAAPPEG
ncbi:MAG TPA: TIR domain-containing protein [Caulobacteraceae bacterium]|nr:TIR domain-containing protein [Caulobacteraceae bacterium]